jgi:hypothetical protein
MKPTKPKNASEPSQQSATYRFENRRYLVTASYSKDSGVDFSALLIRLIVNDEKASSTTCDKTLQTC